MLGRLPRPQLPFARLGACGSAGEARGFSVGTTVRIEIIRTLEGLRERRPQWEALLAGAPDELGVPSCASVRSVFEHRVPPDRTQLCSFADAGAELVAVLPLIWGLLMERCGARRRRCSPGVTDVTAVLSRAQGMLMTDQEPNPSAVVADDALLGRSITAERARQRIARGLRFFALHMGDRLVATTWIVWKGVLFIDEFGHDFPIPPRSFWIRAIFVTPEVRGKRLFSGMLDALVAGPFSDCTTFWSDVEPNNPPSMKAHLQ